MIPFAANATATTAVKIANAYGPNNPQKLPLPLGAAAPRGGDLGGTVPPKVWGGGIEVLISPQYFANVTKIVTENR